MSGQPSGSPAGILNFTLALPAPPSRVFTALTDARHLEHWFCDRCTSEPGPGGRLVMRWERESSPGLAYEARWLVWNPPARVSFRGGHAGYPNGDAGTISFALTPAAGGTRLTLLHDVPAGEAYARFRHEWEQAWPRALARLEKYLTPDAASPGASSPPNAGP